jgi:hypothetical protein
MQELFEKPNLAGTYGPDGDGKSLFLLIRSAFGFVAWRTAL